MYGQKAAGPMNKKEKAKNSKLWTLFRITLAEQKKIETYQRKHPVLKHLLSQYRLGTDHNHKSGLIRGVMDWRINKAYGAIENAFPDNVSNVLRALADYNDHPPAIKVLGGKRYGLIGKAMYKLRMEYGDGTVIVRKRKKRKRSRK